jgi:uncharacterized protein YecE (DUF72 family)
MSELLIGTSGFDYPEWKGLFYPEKLARAKFLEYYSSQFNSLELNGTFYRMPTAVQMRRMIERSGGKIKFTVKAFKDLTHAADKSHYLPLMAEFKKALEPLIAEKVLLCILLQFPESYHYDKHERIYLDNLLKEVSEIPVIVEMRNTRWQNDSVYKELQHRNVGWCITDNPDLKNLLKLEYVSTSDIAYMRFHGRNTEMWYTGDNETRYDYMYPDCELKSFVSPILELLKNTRIVQLFFNNHAKSNATVNARKLKLLLESE